SGASCSRIRRRKPPADPNLAKQLPARRFGMRFLVGKWKVITTRAPGPARASAVGRVGEMAVKDHSLQRESIEGGRFGPEVAVAADGASAQTAGYQNDDSHRIVSSPSRAFQREVIITDESPGDRMHGPSCLTQATAPSTNQGGDDLSDKGNAFPPCPAFPGVSLGRREPRYPFSRPRRPFPSWQERPARRPGRSASHRGRRARNPA